MRWKVRARRPSVGMKEECVCGTRRRAGYVTAVFGFLMSVSFSAHWLLSCYCWQEVFTVNTSIKLVIKIFSLSGPFKSFTEMLLKGLVGLVVCTLLQLASNFYMVQVSDPTLTANECCVCLRLQLYFPEVSQFEQRGLCVQSTECFWKPACVKCVRTGMG